MRSNCICNDPAHAPWCRRLQYESGAIADKIISYTYSCEHPSQLKICRNMLRNADVTNKITVRDHVAVTGALNHMSHVLRGPILNVFTSVHVTKFS